MKRLRSWTPAIWIYIQFTNLLNISPKKVISCLTMAFDHNMTPNTVQLWRIPKNTQHTPAVPNLTVLYYVCRYVKKSNALNNNVSERGEDRSGQHSNKSQKSLQTTPACHIIDKCTVVCVWASMFPQMFDLFLLLWGDKWCKWKATVHRNNNPWATWG